MGRRENKLLQLRLCTQCKMNEIEDEVHFLISCPRYYTLRQNLFLTINNISNGKYKLELLNKMEQFCFLVNGSMDKNEQKIFRVTQKYLVQAWKSRR